VAVDPVGSILARPESLNKEIASNQVEGIGYDFVPKVLDHDIVDTWIKTDDQESFVMARRLIKEEGLLCGGSSGSALVGAIKAAKDLKEGQRCVVILPDSLRNYMSKFLSDEWMTQLGYLEPKIPNEWWCNHTVGMLPLQAPITIPSNTIIKEAIKILKSTGIDQIPVVDNNNVRGSVTIGNLTSLVVSGRIKLDDTVEKAIYRQFKKVTSATTLYKLSNLFETEPFVIVVEESGKVVGVASRIDLLGYISKSDLSDSS